MKPGNMDMVEANLLNPYHTRMARPRSIFDAPLCEGSERADNELDKLNLQ